MPLRQWEEVQEVPWRGRLTRDWSWQLAGLAEGGYAASVTSQLQLTPGVKLLWTRGCEASMSHSEARLL